MTTSQPSRSASAAAFARLDPAIQRWIYAQDWTELREVQTLAIDSVLSSSSDLVIAAATAAGKTEAAFLPIVHHAMRQDGAGFKVLYVGPLKALINDQFFRLESLCEAVGMPVVKWHGDVADSLKQQARERPDGILLITPESLEALFVRRSHLIKSMFGAVSFVVIDELHSFLSAERGVHLASLLRRLERAVGDQQRRIGLSATIGDMDMAKRWLRPERPETVEKIELGGTGERKLQVRSVAPDDGGTEGDADLEGANIATPDEDSNNISTAEADARSTTQQIAAHLISVMRQKGNHLIFTTRRKDVERLADALRATCEADGVPNEFFPHHGSLARDMREELEARLKQGNLPTTAIATSTLELGIDIGSIETVAQVGAPSSIAGLRQRIGRSGRRAGRPAVLRIYSREVPLKREPTLRPRLRLDTVQSIAAIELLNEGFVEAPTALSHQLSTLLHQILAVIVERGGTTAAALTKILLGPGPFAAVERETFYQLLREMHAHQPPLIEEAPDRTLMLGPTGERLTDSYEFFAVFKTPEEYRLLANGKPLGTASLINAFGPGDYLVFAGRRWRVLVVDDRRRTVEVEAAPAGKVVQYDPSIGAALDDRLVEQMRRVLAGTDVPIFLNPSAARHLAEGRETFRLAGLHHSTIALDEGKLILFPWRGTAALDALRLALQREGVPVTGSPICLDIQGDDRRALAAALDRLANRPAPDGEDLAEADHNLARAKYDAYISHALLRKEAARDRLKPAPIPDLCARFAADLARL